jgi:ATP-binding cassette subfamily C protein LapB
MTAESPQKTGPEATAAHIDPLLECLVYLTAHYGRARSAEALKAGLAYDEKGMGPALFCEAAQRLGLKTRVSRRADLSAIPHSTLPVTVTLKGGHAVVLLALSANAKGARIFSPDSGAEKEVKIADLMRDYTGYIINTHPRPEFNDPQTPYALDLDRHWFWGPIGENFTIYVRVAVAALLINCFGLVSPLFIMNVYDRVIPNNAVETGWVLALGALTAFLFDFIMRTLRGYFIDLASRRADVVTSRRIYDHVLDMKLAGRPASAGAFANALREFDSVRDFMTSATMTAVVDLPFTLFFMLVIFLIGGPVALMLTCLIMVVVGAAWALQWPLRNAVGKSMHAGETKHGLLVETIYGLETIKAVSADGRMRARYGSYVAEAASTAQRSRLWSALTVNIATLLQQSASVIVVLMGMYLVRDAHMSMGALIACVMLGSRAIAPIGQVANLMARYHQARSALNRLNDIMKMPLERPASKQFLHRPVLNGKIAFDKVGFSYPGTDRKILDDVSFTINPGERVGLIGRIGSGKSTIARLMMGLYEPSEGTIAIDDTDYRQIDPADLRRNIGYISQDVVLFRGTIRENIAVGKPQATEEDILRAARLSGVHDFVARHPMGYDAPVGERGDGLSGGQRQAVALSRAMLLSPNVLICDEPTNAMDMQAEDAFNRHIRQQAEGKTLILITHRHHLLSLVERLILLDNGRVIVDGPRDKVLQALAQGKVEVPAGKDDKGNA